MDCQHRQFWMTALVAKFSFITVERSRNHNRTSETLSSKKWLAPPKPARSGRLDGGAKNCGLSALRHHGRLMTAGGDQEQVPSSEKACTEGDYAGDHLKNRKLGFGIGLTALLQEPSVNRNQLVVTKVSVCFCPMPAQSRRNQRT